MSTRMILYQVMSFGAVVFLCLATQPPHHGTPTNLADALECKFTAIDSQLTIATEMIENARKELPTSLKELCIKNASIAKPVDCSDIYHNGYRKDGVYRIWPQSRISKGPLDVYCVMEADGGGWTTIQRRDDFDSPEDYFYRDWNAYRIGFGDVSKDFWIGNNQLFALTNQRAYQIRFDLADWEGTSAYATYDEFWIDDELHSYTLHVKGYRGTAGDSFSRHSGSKFSTKDRDNDVSDKHCAQLYKGAWWYDVCHLSNLNGYYLKGQHESFADGVEWHTFKGFYYSLKYTSMKIRPLSFENDLAVSQQP